MIEIMLTIWSICFCLSMITVSYGYYLTRKKLTSKKLTTLNMNLNKVGLFWSNSLADFTSLEPGAMEADMKKTLRTSLMVGFLGLASVPGFVLLFAIVLSIHLIASPRKEKLTFKSPLATDTNLSLADIDRLVQELKQIH